MLLNLSTKSGLEGGLQIHAKYNMMTNAKPIKLIVLFPLYNGAELIERSLQCIADQTMRDFRAIIVENRSTDNSLTIAKEF